MPGFATLSRGPLFQQARRSGRIETPTYTVVCVHTTVYVQGMGTPTADSPRRNEFRRAKAANRPSKFRQRLLKVGAKLFVERGIANVSVEELIDVAGISRATFYGFFANKNELAASILIPVFDSGSSAMKRLFALSPRQAAEGLIQLYLDLWKEHEDALLLTASFDGKVFPFFKKQHNEFNSMLLKLLRVIEAGGLLRNNSAELTIEVLAKTGIPLLRIYKDQKQLENIYRESMHALIIKT